MKSAEEFVRIWQTSSNVQEVSEKCGVSIIAVYGRSQRFRKLGIKLKKFETARGLSMDIEKLKQIAVEALKE